jgi:hypothetical protein
LATGVGVTKLFSSSKMLEQNMLECLRFCKFFHVGVNFPDKSLQLNGDAMAQSGKTIDTTEKACQLQTHSLFDLFSDKEKKFYHNGYWCQC